MTKDEAIHKALKVLNCLNNDRVYETAWVKGAINACEEALEQQDEYVLICKRCGDDLGIKYVEQPAQEPAYRVGEIVNPYGSNIKIKQPAQDFFERGKEIAKWADKQNEQKAWQKLSDGEIIEKCAPIWGAIINTRDREETVDFARAIEQALKEKNHG